MATRIAPFVLGGALLGAAALALLETRSSPSVSELAPAPPRPAAVAARDPAAGAPSTSQPPVGTASAPGGPSAGGEPDAIQWKAPSAWQSAPNPSSMRIATYRVPAAPGDAEGGELSVSRAGGATEANIQRWLGQFDAPGPVARSEKAIQGLHVTIVQVTGNYAGSGMMGGPAPKPHSGWGLLGAIVEAPGSSYFFKLLGPATTVKAARASFDELLGSITLR